MVALLKTSTPKLLETIHDSINKNDYDTIQRTAHNLKGSADTLYAQRLSQAAKQLQLLAQNEAQDSIQSAFDDVKEQYQRLLREFNH